VKPSFWNRRAEISSAALLRHSGFCAPSRLKWHSP